jgi:hypothetical protein
MAHPVAESSRVARGLHGRFPTVSGVHQVDVKDSTPSLTSTSLKFINSHSRGQHLTRHHPAQVFEPGQSYRSVIVPSFFFMGGGLVISICHGHSSFNIAMYRVLVQSTHHVTSLRKNDLLNNTSSTKSRRARLVGIICVLPCEFVDRSVS